jgi:stearoyl-CoA desaturase (delta-9 desaturase)
VKEKSTKNPIAWVNTVFLCGSPVAALALLVVYHVQGSWHWADLVLLALMYMATGTAITAGYHRLYAHNTYDCSSLIEMVYLAFGAAALQNSVLHWASDHRVHHRKVDKDEDPYNINKGFFWAHMGWIFYDSEPDQHFDKAPDLLANKLVCWQHRFYMPIAIATGFGFPLALGFLVGRPFEFFLFGGLLRVVMVHHSTFLINSAAHYFGRRPYSLNNTARDSWWLAFFSFGEGYHNYHHAFQGDYRNGIKWYHWDPSKWLIRSLSWMRLTWRLNRTSDERILKALMRTALAKAEEPLARLPEEWVTSFSMRMDECRARWHDAVDVLVEKREEYQVWADSTKALAKRERRLLKIKWHAQIKEAKQRLVIARAEYALLLHELTLQPLAA